LSVVRRSSFVAGQWQPKFSVFTQPAANNERLTTNQIKKPSGC